MCVGGGDESLLGGAQQVFERRETTEVTLFGNREYTGYTLTQMGGKAKEYEPVSKQREELDAMEQERLKQERLQQEAEFQQFFQRLDINLLPEEVLAVAAQLPQAQGLARKVRKRDLKDQKDRSAEAEKQQVLVNAKDMEGLDLVQTKAWLEEMLERGEQTRGETLQQVNNGDYSNFENLDDVLRNVVASRELSRLMRQYQISKSSDPVQICREIKEEGDGVSALLNPALRLGLSLARRTPAVPEELKDFFGALDEEMTAAVLEETLTHVADKEKVKEYFESGDSDANAAAEQAVEESKLQQIQLAKQLLLMHLSDFEQVSEDGKSMPWEKNIAAALGYCARVSLKLPAEQDDGDNAAYYQERMWNVILRAGGKDPAARTEQMDLAAASSRRTVKNGEEEPAPVRQGMNCAVGGLGNAGVSGKPLMNDGSCGYVVTVLKKGNKRRGSTMSMGLESAAAGKTSQLGRTQDEQAAEERTSALGGQRRDGAGAGYGGRKGDLSGRSAREIEEWMTALETKMIQWQSDLKNGEMDEEGRLVMQMLTRKKMDEAALNGLGKIIGIR